MGWTRCLQTQAFLQNETIQANMCSPSTNFTMVQSCPAICPNADISGIGVRVAFYFQSLINSKSTLLTRRLHLNAIYEFGYKRTVYESKELGARIVVVFYSVARLNQILTLSLFYL